MLIRLLRADLRRNRLVLLVLLGLIILVTTLTSASVTVLLRTTAATEALWQQAVPPDAVQMHAGDLTTVDRGRLADWFAAHEQISEHQLIRTLPVTGNQLWISGVSQADSVLEPAFVTQSTGFDLLISADGSPAQPGPGQVALPVHYQATGLAHIGDRIEIRLGQQTMRLEVVDFVLDAQMNPSMVTSKRFLVSQVDFDRLDEALTEVEYLIEFRTTGHTGMHKLLDEYAAAGLPAQGVSIDAALMKMVNSLTALLVVAAALILALLSLAVAGLALRLAVQAGLLAELPEIAALRAIGAAPRSLGRLLIMKYALLAAGGALLGPLLAIPVANSLDSVVLRYLVRPDSDWRQVLLPPLAALAMAALVVLAGRLCLRRILRMPVTDALAMARGNTDTVARTTRWRGPRLRDTAWLPANLCLAVRSIWTRRSALLLGVLTVATVIAILPTNLASTMADPRFAGHLGIGQGVHVRIDVRDGAADVATLAERLNGDSQVAGFEMLVAQRWEMQIADASWESLPVESGNHETFPLRYESGVAPSASDQIALSHNQADACRVTTGSTIRMRPIGGGRDAEIILTVSGVYSDVTNGGRTAKVTRPPTGETLWTVFLIRLRDEGAAADWAAQTRAAVPGVRVTDSADYAAQTTRASTAQLRLLAVVAAGLATGLVFLITALTTLLQIARERPDISVQRAIGTPVRSIRQQYLMRTLALVIGGTALGQFLVLVLGGKGVGAALAGLGAPGISLFINPALALGLLPVLLAAGAMTAVAAAARGLAAVGPIHEN